MAQARHFSSICARHHRFLATRDDHIGTRSPRNCTQKPSSVLMEIMYYTRGHLSGTGRLNGNELIDFLAIRDNDGMFDVYIVLESEAVIF